MQYVLADGLSVALNEVAFTTHAEMGAGNAVQAHILIYTLNAGTMVTVLQGSNDLTGWFDLATYSSLINGNNFPTKTTGIGFAYVRCKVSVTVAGPAISRIVINTSAQ